MVRTRAGARVRSVRMGMLRHSRVSRGRWPGDITAGMLFDAPALPRWIVQRWIVRRRPANLFHVLMFADVCVIALAAARLLMAA